MKFSTIRSAGLFIWGLVGSSMAAPSAAAAVPENQLAARQDAVTGHNVVYAEADNRAFVGMYGLWEEHIEGQLPLVWTETSRDDTTVYMERSNGFFKLEIDVAQAITRLTQGSNAQVNWKVLIKDTIAAEYPLNGYTVHYGESTEQNRAFYGSGGKWYERTTPSGTNYPFVWTVTKYDRDHIYFERSGGFAMVYNVSEPKMYLQRPGQSLVGWKSIVPGTVAAKVPTNGWTINYCAGPERNFKGYTAAGKWDEICTSGSCVQPWTETGRTETVVSMNRAGGGYKLEIDLETGWYKIALTADAEPHNWKKFDECKYTPEA